MTCRNTNLIFDLRRQITELTRANAGLETAMREHAALATGEIERLKRRVFVLTPLAEQAIAADDWQPIETAPKDETEILLWGPDYDDAEYGRWFAIKHRWVDRCYQPISPTHWRPRLRGPQA